MSSPALNEREIFIAARQRQNLAERDAYVAEACGGDSELRRRIESLLAEEESLGSFLESSPAPVAATIALPEIAERPGSLIGAYKLLEQIGEGGFGVVFMAEQIRPVRRRVAMKILKPGMDSRQVVARFESERQALAIMDHPNIAKVLDGGATEKGRPFFVMELVKGVPITDYCDQNQLTVRERLEMFIPVCQAVQHAHQKGIIHRDLKPSNVLVSMHDATAVPKVIDFGVAKALGQELTDVTVFTGFAQMIGSPLYMSPEQAGQSSLDIDTRSDIYTLGVLLYELLTGTTPFGKDRLRDATYEEIRRIIRDEEPPRPSKRLSTINELPSIAANRMVEPRKLASWVRGDLDWIVMKCLEKDRNRRYETANGLAVDIQRYLADEPVIARPPSAGYWLRKFVRRHKGPVLAAGVVVLALTAGIIGTTWGMVRATTAESRAVAEAKQKDRERATAVQQRERTAAAELDARHRLFQAKFATAQASRWSRRVGQRFASLQSISEAAELARQLGLGPDTVAELRDEAIACLALADVRPMRKWEGWPPGSSAGISFDADLQVYARCDDKGNVSVRNVADDRELASLLCHSPGAPSLGVAALEFSQDGELLAVRFWHNLPGRSTNFQVWDWRAGKCVFQSSFTVPGDAFAFSPNGRHLYLGQPDGTLTIYDIRTWREEQRHALGFTPHVLAFQPDASRLAIVGYAGQKVQVREATAFDLQHEWTAPAGVYHIAWHPDGNMLALGCTDSRVFLCNAETGGPMSVMHGHQNDAVEVQFSPSGDTLLSASWDGTSRLWDPWTGRELVRLAGSFSRFSHDGRTMICRAGPHVTLMELASGREFRPLNQSRFAPGEQMASGGFSPDGRWLAVASSLGIRLWDLASGRECGLLPVSVAKDVQFHPAGHEFYSVGKPGLFRWPVNLQADTLRIGPPSKLCDTGRPEEIGLNSDCRTLALIDAGGAQVFDLETASADRRWLPHLDAVTVVTSPNGQWVATGTHNGRGVKVWGAHNGELLQDLVPDEGTTTLSVSPDGRWLVIGISTRFEIWQTESWQRSSAIDREYGDMTPGPACFSPDGGVLAIALSPSVVQLIDTVTWRPLARLQPSDDDVILWMDFCPNGTQLAVNTAAGVIRLWDLRLIRAQLREMGLDWDQPPYAAPPQPGNLQPVHVEVDLGEYGRSSLAEEHYARAYAHTVADQWREAIAEYSQTLQLQPEHAWAANNLAWCLATCPDPELRDIARALLLAQKSVEHDPYDATSLNTLGVVNYRAGNWPAAIAALQKAEQLEPDTYFGFNAFFLAMAHWQLGKPTDTDPGAANTDQAATDEIRSKHRDEARRWFDQAVEWMSANQPDDAELRRFYAEAAELLEVKDK